MADVPDETIAATPDAEPFTIQVVPAPAVTHDAAPHQRRRWPEWGLDSRDGGDRHGPTPGANGGLTARTPQSRRPWLIVAVMLVLAALALRHLEQHAAPRGARREHRGRAAGGPRRCRLGGPRLAGAGRWPGASGNAARRRSTAPSLVPQAPVQTRTRWRLRSARQRAASAPPVARAEPVPVPPSAPDGGPAC